MSELQTMYRAFFHFGGLSMWHTESPAPEFHASAQLSPCGQYVMTQRMRPDKQKHETIREDLSEYWQPSKELALAVVAPRLRAIGERLIAQAEQYEREAHQLVRPALADAASQPHGSPTGSGE
jgi:hypothetical protein